MEKWEQKLRNLGFNAKKIKLTFFLLLLLFTIGSVFLMMRHLWGLAGGVFALNFIIVLGFYYYVRQVKEQYARKKEEEFANVFAYFRIYIRHGRNIYQALQLCQVHTSYTLRPLLENLLSSMDHDSSIRPFIDFAQHFDNSLIEEVMIAIFQMIDAGRDSRYLWHFNFLFSKYDAVIAEEKYRQKTKLLERINLSAMVGAGILVVNLAIGIMQLIGGVMHGI